MTGIAMAPAATPKLATYAALAGLGLLAGPALQRPEPLVLAVPFLLVLALGLLAARPPQLQVEVRAERPRVLEGEEVGLEILLTAGRTVERLEVVSLLLPEVEPVDGPRAVEVGLAAGEQLTIRRTLRCRRWGGHELGDLLLRAHDRFGLLVWTAEVRRHTPLRIYPRPEALRRPPAPLETQAFAGNERARSSGEGIEFAEVRDFVPGDRVRQINWRVSARRGRLAVNQQHPERNADIVLFLDASAELSGGGTGTLDLTARAAAALAERYLERRDRVGLISFGGMLRWLAPAAGAVQRYRIVEALLDAQVILSFAWKDAAVIPAGTLPPQALVVALTPLLDRRSVEALLDLRARGFDLVVVEVSPLPYVRPEPGEVGRLAHRLWLLEREALHYRFARLGVPVVTWGAGASLEGAMEEVRASRRRPRRVSA